MSGGSKTEQATPRRRQKAREKGQVPRSRELAAGLATMAMVLLLAREASLFPPAWGRLLRDALSTRAESELLVPVFDVPSLSIVRAAAVLGGATWVLAVLASISQGGVVIAPTSLAPSWSRLNPLTRLQQLFSIHSISRLLKSLMPVAAIIYIGAATVTREWNTLLALPSRNVSGLAHVLLGTLFELLWKSALVLLIWACVDYVIERRKFESDLRMSRQEVIEEFKETEGNPTVKSRIRRLQRQVRRRRMLKDVEKAAVVVTNPTQFAIALAYGPETPAPVVVAKGRNLLAAEIKQVARWHGIPLIENPPLAHALYRAVEIGQSIPPKLYRVVAEILAAIYRAQARADAAGVL